MTYKLRPHEASTGPKAGPVGRPKHAPKKLKLDDYSINSQWMLRNMFCTMMKNDIDPRHPIEDWLQPNGTYENKEGFSFRTINYLRWAINVMRKLDIGYIPEPKYKCPMRNYTGRKNQSNPIKPPTAFDTMTRGEKNSKFWIAIKKDEPERYAIICSKVSEGGKKWWKKLKANPIAYAEHQEKLRKGRYNWLEKHKKKEQNGI